MVLASAAPLGTVLLGLLLGMRHATDPDHVVAVTTILSRERSLAAAARVGGVWGLGHTLTVLLVGSAIIVFKIAIPLRLGLAMEFAVALVLIMLGGGAVGGRLRRVAARLLEAPRTPAVLPTVHTHVHRHDGVTHRHPHAHAHLDPHDALPGLADLVAHDDHRLRAALSAPFATRRRLLRSFGVGLVHGMAGSAAIALLVLSAIPEPLWAILYLLVFCVGTIVGMMLITAAIATPFIASAGRLSGLHEGLVTGSGVLSLGFGLFLSYQISIVDHLFGAAPLWIPH